MAGPWEKYQQQGGSVFTLPPNAQTVRQNERQDRNDARVAGNDMRRLATEAARLKLDQQAQAATLSKNPISEKDQAMINSMRLGQGDLPGVLRDITGAQQAVDRFQPAPGRGSNYSWAVPEDGDWPVTAWAKNRIADAAGVTQQDKDNYQSLLRLQNQAVLNAQLAQKGPQTDSDAIRMKLAGISPNMGIGPNARLLAEQQYDALMKQQRPAFYEYWANRLGSTHALNGQGKSADQVWAEQYQRGLEKMRSGNGYRAASGQPVAQRAGTNSGVDSLLKKYGVR